MLFRSLQPELEADVARARAEIAAAALAQPEATLALFGASSGPVPPIDPLILNTKGSLFLTRPTLFAYTATTAQLDETAADLFSVLESGAVKIAAPKHYALADAAQAHRDLEGRATTGSIVLLAD